MAKVSLNIMEKICKDTDRYINEMHSSIDKIIGKIGTIKKHKMNREKSNMFINGQITDRRKRAARNLIHCTYYFTFKQIFESIKYLITNLYKYNNKFILYVGYKGSSTYFIGLIAVYFIRQLGYEIPQIVHNINEVKVFYDQNVKLLIIDDILHSGGQMNLILDKILKYFDHAYILCAVATTKAEESIIRRGKITTYVNYRVKTFEDFMSKEEYMDIIYYFNSYSQTCISSIYLNYKMADFTSCCITALMLGPILPTNLELDYKKMKHEFFTQTYLENIQHDEAKINIQKDMEFSPFICGFDIINIPKMPYGVLLESRNELYTETPHKTFLEILYNKNTRLPLPFYKHKF